MLSTLLNEMDGLQERQGVFFVAATNRSCDLDPALIRPGRLDHIISIDPPSTTDCIELLQLFTKGLDVDDAVSFDDLATALPRHTSPAMLAQFCRLAHRQARLHHSSIILKEHFRYAALGLGWDVVF